MSTGTSEYRFAEFRLSLNDQTILQGDECHNLSSKIYHFLKLLCEYKLQNKILEKDTLAEVVWEGRFVSDEAIARVVASARKVLGDTARNQTLIETVRKRGYRLAVDVEVSASEPKSGHAQLIHSLVSTVEVLEVAAMFSDGFSFSQIAALFSADDKDLLSERLDQLLVEDYLQTDALGQKYGFIDRRQQDTIYDALPLSVKQKYHKEIALWVLNHPSKEVDYEFVHYHLQRCRGLVDNQIILDSINVMAQQALDNYNYDLALDFYQRSLDYAESEAQKYQQKLLYVEAVVASGQIQDTCDTLLEIGRYAKNHMNWEMLARAAIAFNSEQEDARIDGAAKQILQWAVNFAPAEASLLTVKVFARLAESLYTAGEVDKVKVYDQRAMCDARALKDPLALGGALQCHYYSTFTPGNQKNKRAIVEELHAIGEAEDDDRLLHNAYVYSITNALEIGARSEIDLAISNYEQLVNRTQNSLYKVHLGYHKVLQLLLSGRLVEAEKKLQTNFDEGAEWGHSIAFTSYSIQLYGLRYAQGRLPELREIMTDMAKDFPLTPWGLASACMEAECGNRDVGQHILNLLPEQQSSSSKNFFNKDIHFLTRLSFLAKLTIQLGAKDKMHWIYQELQTYKDLHVMVGLGILHLGAVEHFLGLLAEALGEYQLAVRHFQAAEQKELQLGAYCALAQSRFMLARTLRKVGANKAEALEMLQQAINSSRLLSMDGLNQQALKELSGFYSESQQSKLVLVSGVDQ